MDMTEEDKKKAAKKNFGGPLANLDIVERGELELGNSFHAFRFKSGGTVDEALKELQQIEANEVNVGRSFHAFRFNSGELRELEELEKNALEVGNSFHAFRFK